MPRNDAQEHAVDLERYMSRKAIVRSTLHAVGAEPWFFYLPTFSVPVACRDCRTNEIRRKLHVAMASLKEMKCVRRRCCNQLENASWRAGSDGHFWGCG